MEYVGQEKAKSEIKQILYMGLAFPDRKSLAQYCFMAVQVLNDLAHFIFNVQK